ncbi:MAG: hypothetical protein HQM09_24940 [Candidatus Riflebacteria bacterium]|nr:hypothetical protein [Candidatus Riflebacteria bacterium]
MPSPDELEQIRSGLASSFQGDKNKPKVGIFWYYRKKVIGDFCDIASAEICGHVLGPPSDHYSFWPEIQANVPDLVDVEYEYVSRGRVLFNLVDATFVIISSKWLASNKSAIKAIKRRFHLSDGLPLVLTTDLHYENPNDISWLDDDETDDEDQIK